MTKTTDVIGFDGSPMNGREEIAATLGDIFGSHQTARYVAKVREVRRLGPEVQLVRSAVGMVPPGKAELNPAVNALQSLVTIGRARTYASRSFTTPRPPFTAVPNWPSSSRAN